MGSFVLKNGRAVAIFGTLAVLGYLFYFFWEQSAHPQKIEEKTEDQRSVYINNTRIFVDIADSDEEIIRGLSGRNNLLSDHGMLFMLPYPARAGFWMKEMNFSIDIIWINEVKKIVHIEPHVSPETFPKVFYPMEAALYVLEAPAGFSQTHGVKVGDTLRF